MVTILLRLLRQIPNDFGCHIIRQFQKRCNADLQNDIRSRVPKY